MSQRSMRDGVLTIKDGGSNELVVKIGEGNISWSEKREIQYSHNRGQVTEARLGDDQPCDVKFDFVWEWLSSLSGTSVSEAINGEADGWVTTGDECEPYAVDLELKIYSPNNVPMEIITFPEFRKSQLDYDLRAGAVSCSGQCKAGGPTVTNDVDSVLPNLITNGTFTTGYDGWVLDGAIEYNDTIDAMQIWAVGGFVAQGTMVYTLAEPIPAHSIVRVEFDYLQVESITQLSGPNYFWLSANDNDEFEIEFTDFGHYQQDFDTVAYEIDEIEIFMSSGLTAQAGAIDNISVKILN